VTHLVRVAGMIRSRLHERFSGRAAQALPREQPTSTSDSRDAVLNLAQAATELIVMIALSIMSLPATLSRVGAACAFCWETDEQGVDFVDFGCEDSRCAATPLDKAFAGTATAPRCGAHAVEAQRGPI
jgi:hypothetical protein